MRTGLLSVTGLLLIAPTPAAAQYRQISGIVRDASSGSLVPDVRISIAGLSVTACTNDRGEYRITVPNRSVELTARLDGFREAHATIGSTVKTAEIELVQDVHEAPNTPLFYIDGIRISPPAASRPAQPVEPVAMSNEPLLYVDGIRVSLSGC